MNLRNSWKKINKINLHTDNFFTKSTLFILPILGYTYNDFKFSGVQYLINCHVLDIKKPKLFCIFDNTIHSDDLMARQNKLIGNYSFSQRFDDNDGKELVFTFDIGTDFEDDYYRFLDGKYSEFSTDLKDLLFFAYSKQSLPGYKASVCDAIYPTDSKRRAIAKELDVELSDIKEVFDKPDIRIEMYKPYEDLKL